MSDYPMLISNKLHSFRNFVLQNYVLFAIMQAAVLKIGCGAICHFICVPLFRN